MSNKTTRGKNTQSQGSVKVEETVQKTMPANEQKLEKPIVPRDIDPHMIVTVRNGFQGSLVYVSKKTGERFVWDGFGDEQDMEIGELRNARNSSKSFFINNWFMFDEPWVVDYLGLTQYYRFAVGVDDFDAIFDLPINEMIDTFKKKPRKKLADYQKVLGDIARLCEMKVKNPDKPKEE